MTKTVAKIKKP